MERQLNTARLLEMLNAAPGVVLSEGTFRQSLLPLLIERGDAQKIGDAQNAAGVFDPTTIWMWELYLAVRAELIRRGARDVETGEVWHAKRPYSIGEMEGIALMGLYEDVTNALFPAQAAG